MGGDEVRLNAIKMAIAFHEIYERLAPEYGYETKQETRTFDASTPNGQLMIATCREVIKWIDETTRKEQP